MSATDLEGSASPLAAPAEELPLVPIDPAPDSSVTVVQNTASNNFDAVFDVAQLTGGDTVLVGATPPSSNDQIGSNATETGLQVAIVAGSSVSFVSVPLPNGSASTDYIGGASVTGLTNGNFALMYWGSNVSNGGTGGGAGGNDNLPDYYVQIFTPTGATVGGLTDVGGNSQNAYASVIQDPANNGYVVTFATNDETGFVVQRFSNAGVAGARFTFSGDSYGFGAVDSQGDIVEEFTDGASNTALAFIPEGATSLASTGVITDEVLANYEVFTAASGGGFVGFYLSGTELVAQTLSTTGAFGATVALANLGATISANDLIWNAVTLSNGGYALTLEPYASPGYTSYPGTNEVIEVGPALTPAETAIYILTASGGGATEIGPWAVPGPGGTLVTYSETSGTGLSYEGVPLDATVTAVTYLGASAPTLSGGATSASYPVQGSPKILSPALVLSSADPDMSGATVVVAGGFASDGDLLAAVTSGTAITAAYNSATETLTLSGSDTVAHYQAVLRSVAFESTANDPTSAGGHLSRTVTFTATDTNGSATQTETIKIVEVASSGLSTSAVTLYPGGKQTVTSGGTASGTTIVSGSNQVVGAQGMAEGGVVSSGGGQYLSSGGAASGATLSGGNQYVETGGSASATTVDGGTQVVYGAARGTILNDGGRQDVEAGATVSGTTVNSGALVVLGSAGGAIVNSGGADYIDSGGAGGGATVSGGDEYVETGGTASGTTVDGGAEVVYGVAEGATLESGGYQYVEAGGTASGTNIDATGVEAIYGVASGATVRSGGADYVEAGGVASAMQVGGDEYVEAGGSAIGSLVSGGVEAVYGTARAVTVESGGYQYVYAGGVASDTVVDSGGYEEVVSGGTASGATISGGELELTSGAIDGAAAIGFAASGGGALRLDDSVHFGGLVAGFGLPDILDLSDIAFGSSTSLSFVEAGGSASGTLTVTDGVHTANLTLLGQYVTAQFTSANDGHGGVLIGDPPAPAVAEASSLAPSAHPAG